MRSVARTIPPEQGQARAASVIRFARTREWFNAQDFARWHGCQWLQSIRILDRLDRAGLVLTYEQVYPTAEARQRAGVVPRRSKLYTIPWHAPELLYEHNRGRLEATLERMLTGMRSRRVVPLSADSDRVVAGVGAILAAAAKRDGSDDGNCAQEIREAFASHMPLVFAALADDIEIL